MNLIVIILSTLSLCVVFVPGLTYDHYDQVAPLSVYNSRQQQYDENLSSNYYSPQKVVPLDHNSNNNHNYYYNPYYGTRSRNNYYNSNLSPYYNQNRRRVYYNQQQRQWQPDGASRLLKSYDNRNSRGDYNFGYETENELRRNEESFQVGNERIVRGSYSHIGPDGKKYTVQYVADRNGYRAYGDHLPVPVQPTIVSSQSPPSSVLTVSHQNPTVAPILVSTPSPIEVVQITPKPIILTGSSNTPRPPIYSPSEDLLPPSPRPFGVFAQQDQFNYYYNNFNRHPIAQYPYRPTPIAATSLEYPYYSRGEITSTEIPYSYGPTSATLAGISSTTPYP